MDNGSNKLSKEITNDNLAKHTEAVNNLQKTIDEKLAEERKNYTSFKTKVHKGKLAPQGHLFYGVKHKKGITTYTNIVLLKCEGSTKETEQLLFDKLWLGLREKYNL